MKRHTLLASIAFFASLAVGVLYADGICGPNNPRTCNYSLHNCQPGEGESFCSAQKDACEAYCDEHWGGVAEHNNTCDAGSCSGACNCTPLPD